MRMNAVIFMAVILAIFANVFAFDHIVDYNASTSLVLKDGDHVILSNFPANWGYSRVVLGVNSLSASPLSGKMTVNHCEYKLDDYYKQAEFKYESQLLIEYHGSTQGVVLQWWVDSAPVNAVCETIGAESHEDSVWQAASANIKKSYASKIAKYKDLGGIESISQYEGSSGLFKITSLPKWNYNRIYVQVESEDGRELNGTVYADNLTIKLSGWSIAVPLDCKLDLPPTFELAFPEYRKVRLKWWAAMESPEEKIVPVSEKMLGDDSVEATYTFESEYQGKRRVSLKFKKSSFENGKIPVIKKYAFNPNGVMKIEDLKAFGKIGDLYDIDAELKKDDTVTIALPLEYNYVAGKDSVAVKYLEDGVWTDVPVDSVANGTVYLRGFLSKKKKRSWLWVVVPGSYFVCLTGICDDAVEYVWDKTKKFGSWLKELGIDILCVDIDDFTERTKRLFGFGDDDDEDVWNAPQAEMLQFNSNTPVDANGAPVGVWPDGAAEVLGMLIAKKSENFIKLSEAKAYGACDPDDGGEVCGWKATSRNMEILLADAILAQRSGFARRYTFSYDGENDELWLKDGNVGILYSDYFMTTSGLVEQSAWFVKGLQNCVESFNYSGKRLQKWSDLFSSHKNYTGACRAFMKVLNVAEDAAEVIEERFDCLDFVSQYLTRDYDIMSEKNEKVQSISDAMVRVSLLAWLDKTSFRNYALLRYKEAHDGLQEWLAFLGPFIDRNNIVAKAYGSLALYEYVLSGKTENLGLMNDALNHHYGDNGGYSEGTGYSQYIWEDIPYVLAALKDVFSLNNKKLEIEGKFMKSPDYMFEFSRPVGLANGNGGRVGMIPVEIDDGCTYNPDYRVWAKLKDDPKYLAMSKKAPLAENERINPLIPFGFPDVNLYNEYENDKNVAPNRGPLWGSSKDGISMITAERKAKDADGNEVSDTVALSMIAESGDLWKNGQAHDQQDNLSITLASSRDGFIIQDRGYSGYSERKPHDGFHRYTDHNVVVFAGVAHSDNENIPVDEIYHRLHSFLDEYPGLGSVSVLKYYYILDLMGVSFGKDFSVAGGKEASVLDESINEPKDGIVGYTAKTQFAFNPLVQNNRSILYFGGNFWVIDRMNAWNLTWYANSPIDGWDKLTENYGLRLYGSDLTAVGVDGAGEMKVEKKDVHQNTRRADYEVDLNLGGWLLPNYAYSIHDENTRTFVMTYAVNDEGFDKTFDDCPKDYQCFVNKTNDKRLVVPPSGKEFKYCDALPKEECSGDGKSSGITMFTRVSADGWKARWVLDGEMSKEENGNIIKIDEAIVTRGYATYSIAGRYVTEKHKPGYLPAIPLLLLR